MMPHFEQQMGKDFMDRFPKPIGRNSTPEEQAWPMAFLCSPAASYISGENIFTDGGCAGGIMTGSIDPSAMFAGS
jgi:NAD(P)-dependent dehydrogenase (short-subunit alcohol dehydrogenase family)